MAWEYGVCMYLWDGLRQPKKKHWGKPWSPDTVGTLLDVRIYWRAMIDLYETQHRSSFLSRMNNDVIKIEKLDFPNFVSARSYPQAGS